METEQKNITPSSRAELATGQAIDDLAVMVKKGFDETAKQADMNFRFNEVDKRFGQVNVRLGKIEIDSGRPSQKN